MNNEVNVHFVFSITEEAEVIVVGAVAEGVAGTAILSPIEMRSSFANSSSVVSAMTRMRRDCGNILRPGAKLWTVL